MRTTTLAIAWGLVLSACGGRYDSSGTSKGAGATSSMGASTNTGATDGSGATTATGAATGSSATGTGPSRAGASSNPLPAAGASTGGATMVGAGGASPVEPNTPIEPVPPGACPVAPPLGKPSPPFAAPSVVWGRIAMLTWGKLVAPLEPLPPTTDPSWAGAIVEPTLQGAVKALGSAPGVDTYLRQLLLIDVPKPFQFAWTVEVPTNQSLPELLLTARLGGTGRIGIFTEPVWLELHPSISQRGAAVYDALFGQGVPPPPPNSSDVKLDPSLPDRAALEQATVNPACAACHHVVDPPGFALGHFAADGTYRDQDHDLPIDTSGLLNIDGNEQPFTGVEDFGKAALASCTTTYGIADSFLRAALVINVTPLDQRDSLFQASKWQVREGFRNGQSTYAALLRAYIQSPAGLSP